MIVSMCNLRVTTLYHTSPFNQSNKPFTITNLFVSIAQCKDAIPIIKILVVETLLYQTITLLAPNPGTDSLTRFMIKTFLTLNSVTRCHYIRPHKRLFMVVFMISLGQASLDLSPIIYTIFRCGHVLIRVSQFYHQQY